MMESRLQASQPKTLFIRHASGVPNAIIAIIVMGFNISLTGAQLQVRRCTRFKLYCERTPRSIESVVNKTQKYVLPKSHFRHLLI